MTIEAAGESEAQRKRARINLLSLVLTAAIFLWLLYAVASGLGFVHEHHPLPPDAERVSAGGGVVVFVSPRLVERDSPLAQVGHLMLGGVFASYEDEQLVPHPAITEGRGTSVHLFDPQAENLATSPQIFFQFDPDAARPVRATTSPDPEKGHALTGTIALDSLDWTALGTHACAYSLHADENGGVCYRGWFSVTR